MSPSDSTITIRACAVCGGEYNLACSEEHGPETVERTYVAVDALLSDEALNAASDVLDLASNGRRLAGSAEVRAHWHQRLPAAINAAVDAATSRERADA